MSPSIRSRIVVAALLSTLLVWSWAPTARAQAPADGSPDPWPSADAVEPSHVPLEPLDPPPQAWLKGPFGRVPGGSLDDPATAAPLDSPLDTFVRRAPLSIDWQVDDLIVALEVVARPRRGSSPQVVLSSGSPVFDGPDTVGQSLVVATLTSVTGHTSEHAWLLEVPDREPPHDGLYDIPAPGVIVASSGAEMVGFAGDGCYLYLCVDVGRMPPPRTLEALPVGVDELLSMRLGDDSVITGWQGSLTPLGHAEGTQRSASGGPPVPGQTALELAGLEVPASGEWLLELEVQLDRERGWLRTAYRLVAD